MRVPVGDSQAPARIFSISDFSNLGSKILRPGIKSRALPFITISLSIISFDYFLQGHRIVSSIFLNKGQSSVREAV